MTITYIGHSGFAIETGKVTVVSDFYIDPVGVIDDIIARATHLIVTVSHSHRDHLCNDIFTWSNVKRYIIANECRRKLMRHYPIATMPVTFMSPGATVVVDGITIHSFLSTDVGVCYLIDIDDTKIFHAGDFNLWISDGMPIASRRKARGDFNRILSEIANYSPHIDVAMFPVIPNLGGDFAAGARYFLDAVEVGTFIPMHTWGRDREAADALRCFAGKHLVTLQAGDTLNS